MFVPKDKSEKTGGAVETPAPSYVPGIYTTSLVLNDNTVDVAVTVDETNINDIRIVNLDEAVATMFPLLEPSFDELANQILRNQSLDNITYSDDNKYTSMVLLNAIKTTLDKAAAPSPSLCVACRITGNARANRSFHTDQTKSPACRPLMPKDICIGRRKSCGRTLITNIFCP